MTSGPGHLLRRVKAGQFEAEWDNSIDQATADVVRDQPKFLEVAAPRAPDDIVVQSVYPAGAIVRSYSSLEVALYNALAAKDVPSVAGRYRPLEAINQAVRAEILTPAQADAFHELRKLRNQVAHSPDPSITPAQATQYVQIASGLKAAINAAVELRARED
jgi:hypothetical protein